MKNNDKKSKKVSDQLGFLIKININVEYHYRVKVNIVLINNGKSHIQ